LVFDQWGYYTFDAALAGARKAVRAFGGYFCVMGLYR
jgi:hypothetical protein